MMSRISHLIVALTLGLFSLFLLFLLAALPARAVDLTVLNTNDNGPDSLREAIAIASDGDTILFDSSLNGQTITLTSGQLLITKNLTIIGPGANLLAISGNNASRVFSITSIVTVSGVTIKNGNVFRVSLNDIGGGMYNNGGIVNLIDSTVFDNASNGPFPTPGLGGGIYNNGIINLTNSTVYSNTAGVGGGIYNTGIINLASSTVYSNSGTQFAGGISNVNGTVDLTNTTVYSNTAFAGGGIYNFGGIVTLINSTVSNNSAIGSGGTPAGGGILNSDLLNLTNSTVSGNSASSSSGSPIGGGILTGIGTTVSLTNTILANNRVGNTANDCTNDHGGTVTSSGYNLIQAPNSCVFSATGDITNTNPLLGPLANNGGDTLTHALLNGSPAIDHIPNGTNGCGTTITTDQRGAVRPQGLGCDIGAYEVGGLPDNLYLPLIIKN